MTIFLDCDGVLADFNGYFHSLFGMFSEEYQDRYGIGEMWKRIRFADEFFTNLPVMPDAIKLYNHVKSYDHKILTGCPYGNWAPSQKLKWRDKTFPKTEMITCLSKNKPSYGKEGDILIDDMIKAKEGWEKMGGIFIHHTSVEETIYQLKHLGIT